MISLFYGGVFVYVPHENNSFPFFFLYTDLVTEFFQEEFILEYIPTSLVEIVQVLGIY